MEQAPKVTTGTLRPGGLELTRRAVERCAPPTGARLLDVGCGAGTTVAWLRGQGFDALGVDSAPRGPESPHITRQDAAALPFPAADFDALLMECSLSKMADPDAALKEARRVLKTGGALVVSDLFAKGTPAEFEGMLGRLEAWPALCARITRQGFGLEFFEEQPKALASFWAQLVFDEGEAAAGALLGGSAAALKAARCGYFLAVFRAVETASEPTANPPKKEGPNDA